MSSAASTPPFSPLAAGRHADGASSFSPTTARPQAATHVPGMYQRPNTPSVASILRHPSSLQWTSGAAAAAAWETKSNKGTRLRLLRRNVLSPPDAANLFIEMPDILREDKDKVHILAEKIQEVKEFLATMGDGGITVSAYDTAWVALIRNIHGQEGPQFPSSLQWIIGHQLEDGSWGDAGYFNAYDRLMCTLACVIALKTWGASPDQCSRGIEFLQSNMNKLGEESEAHMPAGFEIIFPPLLDMARSLSIDIPCDSSILQALQTVRDKKLKRIPRDLLHNVPTTLLYSLEGMDNLDWEKLLKLKFPDGSFLSSPASTAVAVMNTKDESCLKYLETVVSRYGSGVPPTYPVDTFERLWVVDRLRRLGISRYFQDEIKDSLEHVLKYWTDKGIFSGREYYPIADIDDTSMGFRLLRLHGYGVSPDVLQNFYENGEFFCFAGQTSEAVTPIYNLNRATQVAFPGEVILEKAKQFSTRFLKERQAKGQLLDKWIITKNLPGEVGYTFDFPWIMSLPRVETRVYLDQYGGGDDAWLSKTVYRMPYVSNDSYLELAKLDFNQCQLFLQEDWEKMRKWFMHHELAQYGVSIRSLLENYFLAASTIFEPTRSHERLNWTRTAILAEALYSHVKLNGGKTLMVDLVKESQNFINNHHTNLNKSQRPFFKVLLQTFEDISREIVMTNTQKYEIWSNNLQEMIAKQEIIKHKLLLVWYDWMQNLLENDLADCSGEKALLLVRMLEIFAGRFDLEDSLSYSSLWRATDKVQVTTHNGYNGIMREHILLASLTKSICRNLSTEMKSSKKDVDDLLAGNGDVSNNKIDSLEAKVQELTKHVLDGSSPVDNKTRETFLMVVKSFYYAARCPPSTMNLHIAKVLFERVK